MENGFRCGNYWKGKSRKEKKDFLIVQLFTMIN